MKVEGSLGYGNHEMVEFNILCGRRKAVSSIATLAYRRADFDLLKNLLGSIPWARELENKRPMRAGYSTPLLSPRSVHP